MSLLQVRAISKTFPPDTWAVHRVSLAVEPGEIICLLGPSGCGKTTLLRLIAGLEAPDGGEVIFEGREITRMPPHQRDFGMMFQDFALFPHKNVFENVAFGLRMHGLAEAPLRARVAEMLELVDLRGFDRRDIDRLSGGEQQRVALARALAPSPRLLMLDEPLGALDRALRERLMLELRTILKRVGVTAIYVTHDQTEAFAIADRIAVMNEGRIEQLDPPQTVFERPATPFVARFLGFRNLLAGTVLPSGQVETVLGQLPAAGGRAAGEQVMVLIRPEALQLIAAQRPPTKALSFEAKVTAISFRGKYYQVWVEAQGESLMFELPSIVGWQVGESLRIQLNPAEIIIL